MTAGLLLCLLLPIVDGAVGRVDTRQPGSWRRKLSDRLNRATAICLAGHSSSRSRDENRRDARDWPTSRAVNWWRVCRCRRLSSPRCCRLRVVSMLRRRLIADRIKTSIVKTYDPYKRAVDDDSNLNVDGRKVAAAISTQLTLFEMIMNTSRRLSETTTSIFVSLSFLR